MKKKVEFIWNFLVSNNVQFFEISQFFFSLLPGPSILDLKILICQHAVFVCQFDSLSIVQYENINLQVFAMVIPMSWQSYIDTQLIASGYVSDATILCKKTGSSWANTTDFHVRFNCFVFYYSALVFYSSYLSTLVIFFH